MRNNKLMMVILVVIALLLAGIVLNLCGLADTLKDNLGIDDDVPDDDDDLPDDDDIPEDDDELEEEEDESPHCSDVRYSKTSDFQSDTWTALGVGRNTFLKRTSQIAGGYLWEAFWEGESLGWTSDKFATRFQLLTHLRNDHHALRHMNNLQLWWYECMITTGYGGIF